MRIFTAIDLPPEILLRLERLIVALRPEALINWSPLDNLHITTKFIGEWPESRMEELDQALAQLVTRDPFEVEVKELGWFPHTRAPRVFWAGGGGGPQLATLAYDIEERLLPLGIKKEDRQFSPHLTLARIKTPVPLAGLCDKVQQMQSTVFGKFQVSHFTLFRSERGSNTSVYRRLRHYNYVSTSSAAPAPRNI